MANSDGAIILSVKVDSSEVDDFFKKFNGNSSSFTSTLKKIGGAFAAAFSINKIVQFSKSSAELATQVEASTQRIIDIYGESSKNIGNFIDESARAIGMSKAAAASTAATYGNLLSVWADQEANAELTASLLNQTAVIASKTGRTVTDVSERIRSGLLGNTEAIEDLGVNVNIKTIEMTNAFKKIADGRSWEQLDAYEQSQVRTLAILEQSVKKYGDSVSDTSATVRNDFSAAYEDFMATWGQVVNRVLMPLMQYATSSLTFLTGVMQGLFNISEETIKQAKSTDEAAKSQSKLTEEIKKTEKENKKSLAGFDDINILASNTADSASAGSGSGADNATSDYYGLGQNSGNEIDTEQLEKGIEFGQKMQEFFTPIANTISDITESLGGLEKTIAVVVLVAAGLFIFKKIFDVFSKSKKPLGTISDGFSSLLSKIGSAADAIAVLGGISLVISSIADLLTAFSDSGLSFGDAVSFVTTIVGEVVAAFLALLLALDRMKPSWEGVAFAASVFFGLAAALESVTHLLDTFVSSGLTLGEAGGIMAEVLGLITGAIAALTVAAKVLGSDPMALIAVVAVAASLDLVLLGLAATLPIILDAFSEFIVETAPSFCAIIDTILSGIEKLIYALGTNLPPIIDSVGGLFKEIFGGIGDIVDGVFDGISNTISTIGDTVEGILESIGDLIDKVLDSIIDFTKDAGPAINTFVDNIIQAVTKLINFMISGIEYMVNTLVIGGVNRIIDGVNSVGQYVGFTIGRIPDFKLPPFIPDIPALAKGAVIPPNREFLAVLGDQRQGTNIEAPLQTIVDAFNMALRDGGYNSGKTEVVLEIDGREFGRAVVEQGNRENRRIGTKLVIA